MLEYFVKKDADRQKEDVFTDRIEIGFQLFHFLPKKDSIFCPKQVLLYSICPKRRFIPSFIQKNVDICRRHADSYGILASAHDADIAMLLIVMNYPIE